MPRRRRILVVRPDRIGDVALATPTIRALRHHFPDAFLAVLVRPSTEPVLRHNPHLDAILLDDYENEHAGKRGFFDRLRMLRKHDFDTALMLLPSERHAWMTFLAGIRTRIGVGNKLYQYLTFTRRVSRNKYIPLRHEADYCLDLARRLGVRTDDLSLELYLTQEEKDIAVAELKATGWRESHRLVALHPESGGSAPNWKPENYAALAERVLRETDDTQILVLLSKNGSVLQPLFDVPGKERVLIPAPRNDLRFAMACIDASSVTVSASTGPMHLAAGLGIPTVNLFCPLTACSPALWGPKGNRAEILLPVDGYCSQQCPGDPKLCTFEGGISVEDATAAVVRQLATV
ncbi:MAG: glycosyltransferase family 9 protein [Bacteroidia bacterium]|nr:glycosyltransferase family 9 protein [Bacteroidia bacterium]